MKSVREFFVNTLVGGLLVVVPIYLAVLLLLKAMKSVAGLVQPFANLLPTSLPAAQLLSLLLVLSICFLIGLAVRTRTGRTLRERIEKSLFERIPGYALFRSFTQRLAGENGENVWQPALAEIEDALVPAFIIEELADGSFTVFVPSIPTPLAGAVYVLSRERVHLVDVPFTQAIQTVSRWGSGAKDLVAAMQKPSLAEAAGAISTGAGAGATGVTGRGTNFAARSRFTCEGTSFTSELLGNLELSSENNSSATALSSGSPKVQKASADSSAACKSALSM